MAKALRVGIVENAGPNTLVSFLKTAGEGAKKIDLAVGFLTESGVDSVLYLLKKVAKRGKVRLLTGLYQGFTEPSALRKLLRVQTETKGRISVAVSRDGHFHWKCYFIEKAKSADLIVGSSNLTSDGLKASGELNVVLTVPTDSKPFRDLAATFQRQWSSKATLLTDAVVKKYAKWKAKAGKSRPGAKVPIQAILGGKPAKQIKQDVEAPRFWRESVNGKLDDATEAVLTDTTDWDRRNYLYLSTWNTRFKVGDKVILFELDDNLVRIVKIMDTTETPHKTPDGVHFAAYTRVGKVRFRRLVRNRWKSLKQSKLIKLQGDAASTRKISEATYDRFVENLKHPAT